MLRIVTYYHNYIDSKICFQFFLFVRITLKRYVLIDRFIYLFWVLRDVTLTVRWLEVANFSLI
jgi:hypothetical protein